MTDTTSRLLALLSLLQARREWPGSVLAERLEVTGRTVRRDVERMRRMGYRIQAVHGPDGGYRLDAGSEPPPLLFDDEQVIALTIALQAAPLAGAGVEEAAQRALTTVRQVLPSRLRHRVDALRFTAMDAAPGPVDPARLATVSAVVDAREHLRFDYQHPGADDPGPVSPPRLVEPHHLVASGGQWYLIAWDVDRADWRVFRVDRLTPRTHRGAPFAPRPLPGGDPHRFLRARFAGATEGQGWPCRASVVLHLPAARVLPFVEDGSVEPLGPDRCILVTGAWSWNALAAQLGRFDCEIEVPDAPELRSALATLADRFARAAG